MTKVETKHMKQDSNEAESFEIHGVKQDANNKSERTVREGDSQDNEG